MESSFTGISKITLEPEHYTGKARLVITDLRLELSEDTDKDVYLKDNLPTKEGVRPLTQALLQGLITNIKMSHQLGYWDESEHMRYIAAELERGFVSHAAVSESTL